MPSVIARGLAMTAMLAALAAAAGCKDDGGGDGQPTLQPTGATATGSVESTASDGGPELGRVDVGDGSDEGRTVPEIHVPTANVGEPAGGRVDFVNTGQVPTTLQHFAAATDTGETSITENGCENVELQPGENCQVVLSHTAEEPGRFSVTLTAVTSQGTTLTVPLSGEAAEASKPTTAVDHYVLTLPVVVLSGRDSVAHARHRRVAGHGEEERHRQ
ncbi:hypothetical protein ACFRH4_41125 [Streptomyces mirabilis]|uniref:hypothetical protein n=1 Tax=Streptomyces mirabilis TaxID=68239 RepID=UPI00367EBC5E